MEKMHINNAKNIIKYRTRMVNVKCNYKNKYKNLICRWCNSDKETQKHILEECDNFPVTRNNIKEEDIFDEDYRNLYDISKTLELIYKELDKK